MSHLAHKFAWKTLAASLTQDEITKKWYLSDKKAMSHFVRTFADTVIEFAQTAQPIEDDEEADKIGMVFG